MVRKTLSLCLVFGAIYPLILPGPLYAWRKEDCPRAVSLCNTALNHEKQALRMKELSEQEDKQQIKPRKLEKQNKEQEIEKIKKELINQIGKMENTLNNVVKPQNEQALRAIETAAGQAKGLSAAGTECTGLDQAFKNIQNAINQLANQLRAGVFYKPQLDWAREAKSCASSLPKGNCTIPSIPGTPMPEATQGTIRVTCKAGKQTFSQNIPTITGVRLGQPKPFPDSNVAMNMANRTKQLGQRVDQLGQQEIPQHERMRDDYIRQGKNYQQMADKEKPQAISLCPPQTQKCGGKGVDFAEQAAKLKAETEALLKQAQSLMGKEGGKGRQ